MRRHTFPRGSETTASKREAHCASRPEKLAPREADPHAPPHAMAQLTDLGRQALDALYDRDD
jgi:hypothetical protein